MESIKSPISKNWSGTPEEVDYIKNDIKTSISDRKRLRGVNESMLLKELGKDDLDFIRKEIKRIEWRTEDAEKCNRCHGCYLLGKCANSCRNYILDLEKMDLMVNTAINNEGVYEYIDFIYDEDSLDWALSTISLRLEYYEQ